MIKIFISHRHDYSHDYFYLKQKLEEWGFEVDDRSWHVHRLRGRRLPDDEITALLREAIESCDVFIVVARPASGYSDWCKWEAQVADAARKPILGYSPKYMWKFPAYVYELSHYKGTFTYMNRLETLLAELGLM